MKMLKKLLLLMAVLLGSFTAFAQSIDKAELKQLQAFLSQPAAEQGLTNAQALKINDFKAPAAWEGITIVGGKVTEIKWNGKKLAGSINLSGFSALTSVDISRNSITSATFAGDAALTEVKAYRNKLTDANFAGCTQLRRIDIYRNRLTSLDISGTPLLETLNASNNRFAEFSAANSTQLNSTQLNSTQNPKRPSLWP